MVVADPVQVVIASNVEGNAILVEDRSASWRYPSAEPAASSSIEVQPNVYRVARIELEEAPNRPAAQGMTGEALFTLKKGHFVSHVHLIGMPVVFRTAAVGQMWQGIRDVVVRCCTGTDAGAAREQLGVYVQQLR